MEAFKNKINSASIEHIAKCISLHDKKFDNNAFIKECTKNFSSLELKQRILLVASQLDTFLTGNTLKKLNTIEKSCDIKKDQSVSGFPAWALSEFVALYTQNEFDASMLCLQNITQAFSSEFAVRKYLIADEKAALKFFKKWSTHSNEHIRRLSSEGSRPLLPWGEKITSFVNNPDTCFFILDQLKNDKSLYVRKSVANHMNDHSKKHPAWTVEKLKIWKSEFQDNKEIDWLVKHASRTLIKKSYAPAFPLHGSDNKAPDLISQKQSAKKIKLGTKISFDIELYNPYTKKLNLIVDHEVGLLKSNKSYNTKCFKGKKLSIPAKSAQTISLSLHLKPVTTRTYYSGKHLWNLKINGKTYPKLSFDLIV